MKERSRARNWAVQALYAWETRGGDEDSLPMVLHEIGETHQISSRNRLYADVLIRIVSRRRAELDSLISRHLTNWNIDRLSVIDRNILRLGAAEILYVDDVPGAVTIREMLRLAERYGTPESPRFINGVLDAILRNRETESAIR